MTLEELLTKLESTGYDVAYGEFNREPTLPYIKVAEVSSMNLFADNKVYKEIGEVQIELYSSKRDLIAEGKVQTALSEVPWQRSFDFDTDEKIHTVYYTVSIIKK